MFVSVCRRLTAAVLLTLCVAGCGNSISTESAAEDYRAAQERDAKARGFNSVEEMEAAQEAKEAEEDGGGRRRRQK